MSDISRDALSAVFTQSGDRPRPVTQSRAAMGGTTTLTFVGGSSGAHERCWMLLGDLERLWSRFLPDSDITRLNWAEGEPCEVDERTVLLIEEMKQGFVRTSGAFDPTLLPDVVAAGYGASKVNSANHTTLPDSAVAPGNIEGTVIEGRTVRLPRGTTVDAGGIGKGLAADIIAATAIDEGIWGVMAEVSGDIRVKGQAPDGIAWRLGVENPFNADEHVAIVRLPEGGIVTSSQRKRRFGRNSETHHLIDPTTRRSAETNAQTVTVIASTAAKAETLTKPGFLRPVADYLGWLPTVGAAGLVIDSEGQCRESENWSLYR